MIRVLCIAALLTACSSDPKTQPPAPAPAPVPVPAPAPVPDAEPPPPAPAPTVPVDPTAPAATNLQVLPKSWSADRVRDMMKASVAPALGVKCDFCHVKGDFASDANEHKEEARAMMRMTNELNAQFFEGKSRISCMTCHMGAKEPKPSEG